MPRARLDHALHAGSRFDLVFARAASLGRTSTFTCGPASMVAYAGRPRLTQRSHRGQRFERRAVPVDDPRGYRARVHGQRARLGAARPRPEIAGEERALAAPRAASARSGATRCAYGLRSIVRAHAIGRADGLGPLGRDAHQDDERQLAGRRQRSRRGLADGQLDVPSENATRGAGRGRAREVAHASRVPVETRGADGREGEGGEPRGARSEAAGVGKSLRDSTSASSCDPSRVARGPAGRAPARRPRAVELSPVQHDAVALDPAPSVTRVRVCKPGERDREARHGREVPLPLALAPVLAEGDVRVRDGDGFARSWRRLALGRGLDAPRAGLGRDGGGERRRSRRPATRPARPRPPQPTARAPRTLPPPPAPVSFAPSAPASRADAAHALDLGRRDEQPRAGASG